MMHDGLSCHAARCAILVALLAALLGGALPVAPVARAATPDTGGQWRAIPQPREARTEHTATALADGRVLVAGVGSSELFDPATLTWGAPVPMVERRYQHAATLLRDGRVLVSGARSEFYDPQADRWTAGPPQRIGEATAAATLLPDGRVLAAGNGAEIYNPAIDRWTPVASPRTWRVEHTATPLLDGRVLLVGDTGFGRDDVASAEIFDPATETWHPAAPPGGPWRDHVAAALPGGRVLIAGGRGAGAAIYEPAVDRWTRAAPLRVARLRATATALPDGRVLVVGGEIGDPLASAPGTATAELYDPAADTWTLTTPPLLEHRGAAAAALSDGRVLVVGDPTAQRNADLYDPAAPAVRCFAETGHCLRGRFLAYWDAHGGLALNGFPLSDERVEYLEDGLLHQVQYFERTRLEYHLAAAPYDIQLGQFGRRFHPGGTFRNPEPPAPPIPGATFFAESGHNFGGRFRDYWLANGGLAQFGFPITEEGRETLEDGKEYLVQYFERARLEYHPENPAPSDVLLGQFGRTVLADADLLAGPFARFYSRDPALRIQLGPPASPPATVPGAALTFGGGAMFYRADTRQVLALCHENGNAFRGRWWAFPDTWDAGQPAGGGPGPGSNAYEPGRGFGKVWREQAAVRDCLGYASAPGETGLNLTFQRFARGQIASALTAPDGVYLYAITGKIVLYDDGTYETYNP